MSVDVTFVDSGGRIIATAVVDSRKKRYSGAIDLQCTPASFRRLFEEYEAIVNDQVFSLLDQMEDRINSEAIYACFANGPEQIKELQISPRAGTVSFELVHSPAPQASR